MTIIKKILSVLIVSTISLSLVAGAFATEITTVDLNKMATALNKLNILQGTNGNYLLNNKIERSQAAALIIRMLGKENFVKQNTELLKVTKYADVSSKEWYAPYVGYCTQYNIMGGYPDGSFAPKDYISEKSFIKMALCALGYVYNTDFDWSNVYQKAFSIGIVTDQTYAVKTQDNNNYLRSGAVNVIYTSLNAFKKGSTSKMVFTLVDEGVFTRDAITASGILGADKATEIDVITATGINSIEINLNENIRGITAADISIYDTLAAGSSLAIQSTAFANDKIQVITGGQIPGRVYNVRINSITDINGNISGQLTSSFTGYVHPQVTSDFFKIMKIEQVSGNVVNVYFTQPVNANCETAAYYELMKNGATYVAGTSQNFTVKKLQSSNNAVSILLKNIAMAQNDVYSIKVSGKMTSTYGAKLGDGYGESMDFVTTVSDTTQLAVTSVTAWTSTTVRIVFSRDIDSGWAEKSLNYSVYDANKTGITVTNAVKTTSGDAVGRTIILNLATPLDRTKQYEVKMEYIPDIYKQSAIESKSFTFPGTYTEKTELAITQSISEFDNSVVFTFNRALDTVSASNTSNYTINSLTESASSIAPVKAYYSDMNGNYTVKLYLPAGRSFSSGNRYLVYVAGIKDLSGSPQTAPLLRAEFTGSSRNAVKPQIADAVNVSKDSIKLLFYPEIALDLNNINTSNYSLEYVENGETLKMEPIAVTYVDATTLVLRFDALDPAKTYQIRFKSINDYSGVYNRTATEGANAVTVRQGR